MQKRTRYALASGAALLISVGGIAALSGPAIAEGPSGHAAHAAHTVQSHGSGRAASAPERSDGDGEHADDPVETGADHETADDRAGGADEKTDTADKPEKGDTADKPDAADKAGHDAETGDDAAHSSEGAGE